MRELKIFKFSFGTRVKFSVEPAVFPVKKFKFGSFFAALKEVNNKRILLKSYVNDYTLISRDGARKKGMRVSDFPSPPTTFSSLRRNTITLPVISLKISYLFHKCDYFAFHLLSSFSRCR